MTPAENQYLITASGRHILLADLGATVTGLSDIPVEYQTTRGYQQHGHTVKDWRLEARTLNITFDTDVRDRITYWQQRERLFDALRPNVGQPVTLRTVLPDGRRRDIDGWLQSGLSLEQSPDLLAFGASFSLECPDPTLYDPGQQSAALEVTAGGGFMIPFVIPDDLWFGGGAVLGGTVSVGGTFRTYPTIEIAGPFTSFALYNNTTGGFLTIHTSLAASDTLTIDLNPGQQSITDQAGTDCIGYLSGGDLLSLYLQPGTNEITTAIGNRTSGTAVSLRYYERYIAL